MHSQRKRCCVNNRLNGSDIKATDRRRSRACDGSVGNAVASAGAERKNGSRRHKYSQRLKSTLAGLARHRAVHVLCRVRHRRGKMMQTWFAVDETRPLLCFAGLWTTLTSGRKVKEGPVSAEPFGFLTCQPNAEIAKVYPKAMPVVLMTGEERETWLRALERGEGSSASVIGRITARCPARRKRGRGGWLILGMTNSIGRSRCQAAASSSRSATPATTSRSYRSASTTSRNGSFRSRT